MLLYVVCFLHLAVQLCCDIVTGCVGCCDFCLICDACSWKCSFMGRVCVFRRVDGLCLLYTQLLF